MRRKRRNRGNWMPLLGHTIGSDNDKYDYSDLYMSGGQVTNTNEFGGTFIEGPTPVVPDFTQIASRVRAEEGASLHDRVEGNAWLLQRLVGNVFLKTFSVAAGTRDVIWPNVYVTAGFFVARADDRNQGVADLTGIEVDPQGLDNATNPWIWRRSWVLGGTGSSDGASAQQRSTQDFGSLAEGSKIDTKIKRYINAEHRLFWVVIARGFDFCDNPVSVSGPDGNQMKVGGTLDLRVYGSLRRQRNKSSF